MNETATILIVLIILVWFITTPNFQAGWTVLTA